MKTQSRLKAWLEHYRRLLKVEFDWDTDYLCDEPPVEACLSQSPVIWFKESYLSDEEEQSTRPIRHSGGDNTRSQ